MHPERDTWWVAAVVSELLGEAGRTEDAVAVLEPHVPANSSLLAWHLIDLGRIKEVVAVLQERRR